MKLSKKSNIIYISILIMVSIIISVFSSYPSSPVSPTYAQDVDCVGPALADYIAIVFDELEISPGQSSFGHVKFLSPVFNMTRAEFPAFANSLSAGLSSHGYGYNNFHAIAGNAYNTTWGNITSFVNTARGTAIGGQRIILTETGWYPHDTNKNIDLLRTELSAANVDGALIFNVFGYNPQFSGQQMSDDEISQVCSGDCSGAGIGANSAQYYHTPDLYNRARTNNMKYTIEIFSDFNSTLSGINDAHQGSIVPIVRFGTMNSGGPSAIQLAALIKAFDSNVSKDVYVIIGSNEPLAECWATPSCGCDVGQGIGGDQLPPIPPATTIWPDDPTHIYVPLKGNEDLIERAKESLEALVPIDYDPVLGISPLPWWTCPINDPQVDAEFSEFEETFNALSNPNKDELKNWALDVSNTTNVRAALILALMFDESGFEQFYGDGQYSKDICGSPLCCPVAGPIACNRFRQIWKEITGTQDLSTGVYQGYSIGIEGPIGLEYIPVSKAENGHCGGAMGPSQLSITQWVVFDDDIKPITGNNPPSPWNYYDSFACSALNLGYNFKIAASTKEERQQCASSGGAKMKTCVGEACSLIAYNSGKTDMTWIEKKSHARLIVGLANKIAEQITNENSCTGSPFGTGGFEFPISPSEYQIKITCDAACHWGRTPHNAYAWDFSVINGTNVYPTKEGVIFFRGVDTDPSGNVKGYGVWAKVDHGFDDNENHWTSRYGHMTMLSDVADIGTEVRPYTDTSPIIVGLSDNTGNSTGPHLHFEIRMNGTAVDPAGFFGPATLYGYNP